MRLAGLIAATLTLGTAPIPPGSEVSVKIEGMRSNKGQVFACLTARPRSFPDCKTDPLAHRLTISAGTALNFSFGPIGNGSYAIAVLHDENGNGKADMALMLPKEGFGFSRNPRLRFGPPRFASAAFSVGSAPVRETIQMRYIF